MKPFQALGPDGLQAVFYQQTWRVVWKAMTDMALSFFENGTLPAAATESTLVLIPKVEKPEFVTQLRPISLNNVILKVVTKEMTSRMKPIMKKLISPRQISFIPGDKLQIISLLSRKSFIHCGSCRERGVTWWSRSIWRKPMTDSGGISCGTP
ncbi:unnamed protein product [Linum trigynum]|uniref:Reverse transcriptase domain-containing protein n=1 Tax=Linum trigynum TaxID=586398 RepID=A0AAV2EPQ5_9ROSI